MKLLSAPQKCVPALAMGGRVYCPVASYIMTTSMREIAVIVGKHLFLVGYNPGAPRLFGQRALLVLATGGTYRPLASRLVEIVQQMYPDEHADVVLGPDTFASGETACLLGTYTRDANCTALDGAPPPWDGAPEMACLACEAPLPAVPTVMVSEVLMMLCEVDNHLVVDLRFGRPRAPKRADPAPPAPPPKRVSVVTRDVDGERAEVLQYLLHPSPENIARIRAALIPAAEEMAAAISLIEAAGGAVAARAPPPAPFADQRQRLMRWALERRPPAPAAEPRAASRADVDVKSIRTGIFVMAKAHSDCFRVCVYILFQNTTAHFLVRSLTVEDVAAATGRRIDDAVAPQALMQLAGFLMACAYAASRPAMSFKLWINRPLPTAALGTPYGYADQPAIAPNLWAVHLDTLASRPVAQERVCHALDAARAKVRCISDAREDTTGLPPGWEMRFLAPRAE